MPTQRELYALDRSDLANAIHKYGGYPAVAKALGYRCTGLSRPRRWSSVEDLRPHLDPIVASLGRMPVRQELEELARYDLVHAIEKFGGVSTVARSLGCQYVGHRRSIKWHTAETLRPFLDPIVAELGRMPDQRDLGRRGRFDLAGAIAKLGGYPLVAKALDYPYDAPQSWPSIEAFRPHLEPLVLEMGRMPLKSELVDRGYTELASAMARFGGLRAVAGALGYHYVGRKVWSSIEDLRQHLDSFVAELGRMPSETVLRNRGRQDLVGAIRKFGGQPAVAKTLGYRDSGLHSWSSIENLRLHLAPIVTELGRMPNAAELTARGYSGLSSAIGKFGGYPIVAQTLGFRYIPGAEQWSIKMSARLTSREAFKPSKLEIAAQPLLAPFEFGHHSVRREAHNFDYGRAADGRVVEINGCYWHDHRAIGAECPIKVRPRLDNGDSAFARDERIRGLAHRHGLSLLELWGCEQAQWDDQIRSWLQTPHLGGRRSPCGRS
jgi:molybdenum-dependent DNA-binding transcriptional regulator ModE